MSLDFNPFTAATAGRYFVGREEQLRQFHQRLNGLKANQPGHLYVAGLHGTGKTSYLTKLAEISDAEGFLVVQPTLTENHTAHEHISTILRSLVQGLNDKRPNLNILGDWDRGKDSALFIHRRSDQLDSDLLRQDFDTISKLLRDSSLPGAVICIDEGQRIHHQALSALKNALQNLYSYLVVISLRLVQDTRGALQEGRALLEEKARLAEGDFGASRFYVTGVPIGPFDSDEEAKQCVTRRLEYNVIQFEDDVIRHINAIARRIPREIISLSSQTYEKAASNGISVAGLSALNDAFRTYHNDMYREARVLCERLSNNGRYAIEGLVAFRDPATAEQITDHLYPKITTETRVYVVNGIKAELDMACTLSAKVARVDDTYVIAEPAYAHALELVLSVTVP